MTEQITYVPDVRKTVIVAATAEEAFEVFTRRPMEWFPANHVLVEQQRVSLVFERHLGGRYYETAADGAVRDWGVITRWEPPNVLRMTWRINGKWQSIPDDEFASEIEVTFTPLGDGTTEVELAHVELHKHGPDAHAIHAALDGPSPGETLANFAKLF